MSLKDSIVLASQVFLSFSALGGEITDFSDDETRRALNVNEGQLEFLSGGPDKPVHHHFNEFIIDAESLKTGWVRLTQCHEHLDVFERVEIVFEATRIAGLRVIDSNGIESVRTDKNSVQLENVQSGAHLCIELRSQALSASENGYTLRSGPYMRKFLDGYYPMQVSMTVQYPGDRIQFQRISPEPQTGFTVNVSPGKLAADAWFQGRLEIQVKFQSANDDRHINH